MDRAQPSPSVDSGEREGYVGIMAHIEMDVLVPFAASIMEGSSLTPAERGEVLRIAQGFACKDSAAAGAVSPETIRARRKRIYRKLGVPGSSELIATMLARALAMLASGERIDVAQPAPGSRLTVAPSE